jgi:hypothetical protein
MNRLLVWIAVASSAFACSAPKESDAPEPVAAAAPARENAPTTCAHAPDWRHARIELPPEFAPTMARGVEHLYFAPGMFQPDSPTYFTYVFSLDFEAQRTWDVPSMTAMLETYYRGLMSAVAESKERSVAADATRATVHPTDSGFAATVETVDAFTIHAAITLHMMLTVEGACVRAAVAPVAPGTAVWHELERALHCVPCAR